jgi:hypothetical protein
MFGASVSGAATALQLCRDATCTFSTFAANKGMAFQPHGMRLEVFRNINLQQRMETTQDWKTDQLVVSNRLMLRPCCG